jgi:3-hydroxyacyl-[acyl-carrier-protein] dehydratase
MNYNELPEAEKFQRILECVPQQSPFRFVDRLISVDDSRIVGEYRFRQDEWFYKGHFPGNPITPGVILTECMAQIGLVSLAIHHWMSSNRDPKAYLTLFQSAELEFFHPVKPGELVRVMGEKQLFKMGKVKSRVQLFLEDETLAASGTLTGMGVKK